MLKTTWCFSVIILFTYKIMSASNSRETELHNVEKLNTSSIALENVIDSNGYLIFCTCMGRFGNQAEHYLGALGFAKSINRTLLLPPFRTYKNVRFDAWFSVPHIRRYHSVMVAEDFMSHLAPTVWPEGQRIGFCFSWSGQTCQMKEGNPFGPFWDGLGVDFDRTDTYDMGYDDHDRDKWIKRFPPTLYPVLALKGAPASYPMKAHHLPLQEYLVWSAELKAEVDTVVEGQMGGQDYVAVHLRNGPDWIKACEHAEGQTSYMASYQCLGHAGQHGRVSGELCLPPQAEVLRLTRKVIEQTGCHHLYVATDKDPMLTALTSHLKDLNVSVTHYDPHLPQIDLAILGRAKHFIGNCVSSMSAFVYRERLVAGLPTSYFTFTT